jgi:hypothetical protein
MAAGHRQQQLEILVARGQVFVEFLDVGARQQVAAQQLERRPQVIVHVGERQQVGVAGQPVADHGHHRRERAAFVAQPEQIGRRLVGQGAVLAHGVRLPRGAGLRVELRDALQNQREQLRVGARDARPQQLAGVIEQAQRVGARQQRAHQLGVRCHGGFEGHQRRTIA